MSFSEESGIKPYRYERPLYGGFGVLTYVGQRLECHLCGRTYLSLQRHAFGMHGLPADEYREFAGLPPGTALIADSVRRAKSRALRRTWNDPAKRKLTGEVSRARWATDPTVGTRVRDAQMERWTSEGPARRKWRETRPKACPDGHPLGALAPNECPLCRTKDIRALRLSMGLDAGAEVRGKDLLKGIPRPLATQVKISAKHRGRTKSDEWRVRIKAGVMASLSKRKMPVPSNKPKLSPVQRQEIFDLWNDGIPKTVLARRYGVSYSLVSKIVAHIVAQSTETGAATHE